MPAVNRSQESVHAGEAADELATIIAALASPTEGGLARTALCTRIWGGTPSLLLADPERLGRDLAELRHLARTWRWLGVLGVVGYLLNRRVTGTDGEAETARSRILGSAGGERLVTDLLHVAELAHTAGDRPATILAWLRQQRDSAGLGKAARLRLEDDGDAVAVLTVHSAKGLEWPVVFAPFLWCTPSSMAFIVSPKGDVGSKRPAMYRGDAGGSISNSGMPNSTMRTPEPRPCARSTSP